MKKAILITSLIILIHACRRASDIVNRSAEQAPGAELAGTYSLEPSYGNEILVIEEDGKVQYSKNGQAVQNGLAYKNRFRLIIFLDQEVEPGVFMLNDRTPERWPGYWNGEIRFLRWKRD
jgi:hypothetical protein